MIRLENREEPKVARTVTTAPPQSHLLEDGLATTAGRPPPLPFPAVGTASAGHQRPELGGLEGFHRCPWRTDVAATTTKVNSPLSLLVTPAS